MINWLKNLAKTSGKMAMEARRTMRSDAVHIKTTASDLVTDIDRQVERFIIDEIRKKYPDHGILGEETGERVTESDYRWIIDPIDGTTSFVHDYPFYCVSIAVEKKGKLIAGAVYIPRLDELFHAELGMGAYLNDEKIQVSDCNNLAFALMATGFACVRQKDKQNNLPIFNHLLMKIQATRRDGSAAIDLCYVACGRIDGYWELALQPYDIAAGVIIAREAGAIVCDVHGKENFPQDGTVAVTPELKDNLIREMKIGIKQW